MPSYSELFSCLVVTVSVTIMIRSWLRIETNGERDLRLAVFTTVHE